MSKKKTKLNFLKIFTRFRKCRNGRVLDAHDYGYDAWTFYVPVRKGKK